MIKVQADTDVTGSWLYFRGVWSTDPLPTHLGEEWTRTEVERQLLLHNAYHGDGERIAGRSDATSEDVAINFYARQSRQTPKLGWYGRQATTRPIAASLRIRVANGEWTVPWPIHLQLGNMKHR